MDTAFVDRVHSQSPPLASCNSCLFSPAIMFPSAITPVRHSRRAILSAGTLAMMSANGSADAREVTSALSGFGQAKRCILLFMWGGPSQLDTFDMKPDAPAEIRGEFKPISTSVSGLQICEHFQHLAPLMDRASLIRSMTHDDVAHLSSAHTTLTGQLPPVNKSDAEPPSERDTPHLGCTVGRFRAAPDNLPSFVTLPWKTLHPAAPGGVAPGQTGGWLGRSADPFLVTGDPSQPDWSVPALSLQDGVDPRRLDRRRHLLRTIEHQQHKLLNSSLPMTGNQSRAFNLLTSQSVRSAFDLSAEPAAIRDRYGRNIHGQCVLMARRLLEHDVPVVSVNWHNDGKNFWDTHGNNFDRLKNDLIPPADQALATLLTDLEDRRMLDDTIVAWFGEFGRRPMITAANAGREHHSRCYSALLAGGGIRPGAVYGCSDERAEYPSENPVSPQDFVATIQHALGIPAAATLPDQQGRPHRLYGGTPVLSLF